MKSDRYSGIAFGSPPPGPKVIFWKQLLGVAVSLASGLYVVRRYASQNDTNTDTDILQFSVPNKLKTKKNLRFKARKKTTNEF